MLLSEKHFCPAQKSLPIAPLFWVARHWLLTIHTFIAIITRLLWTKHSSHCNRIFCTVSCILLFFRSFKYVHMMFLNISCHTYNWRHETEFYNIYDKPFCEGEKDASGRFFLRTPKKKVRSYERCTVRNNFILIPERLNLSFFRGFFLTEEKKENIIGY